MDIPRLSPFSGYHSNFCYLSSGHTETGQPSFVGETEHLFIIKEAAARLNRDSLGPLSHPTQPIAFGDTIASSEPVLTFGRLYLQHEVPSQK